MSVSRRVNRTEERPIGGMNVVSGPGIGGIALTRFALTMLYLIVLERQGR